MPLFKVQFVVRQRQRPKACPICLRSPTTFAHFLLHYCAELLKRGSVPLAEMIAPTLQVTFLGLHETVVGTTSWVRVSRGLVSSNSAG
jgi:hypothetical protein